jgi:hypothetical protein
VAVRCLQAVEAWNRIRRDPTIDKMERQNVLGVPKTIHAENQNHWASRNSKPKSTTVRNPRRPDGE